MMIKEQVKALWKICFDDSEEFVEMYFRLRYKTEVNVAIQSGDEVISALQMLPYPMTFGGETGFHGYGARPGMWKQTMIFVMPVLLIMG